MTLSLSPPSPGPQFWDRVPREAKRSLPAADLKHLAHLCALAATHGPELTLADRELAAIIGCSPGTVRRRLQRLETAGWIERTRDAKDLRVVVLTFALRGRNPSTINLDAERAARKSARSGAQKRALGRALLSAPPTLFSLESNFRVISEIVPSTLPDAPACACEAPPPSEPEPEPDGTGRDEVGQVEWVEDEAVATPEISRPSVAVSATLGREINPEPTPTGNDQAERERSEATAREWIAGPDPVKARLGAAILKRLASPEPDPPPRPPPAPAPPEPSSSAAARAVEATRKRTKVARDESFSRPRALELIHGRAGPEAIARHLCGRWRDPPADETLEHLRWCVAHYAPEELAGLFEDADRRGVGDPARYFARITGRDRKALLAARDPTGPG